MSIKKKPVLKTTLRLTCGSLTAGLFALSSCTVQAPPLQSQKIGNLSLAFHFPQKNFSTQLIKPETRVIYAVVYGSGLSIDQPSISSPITPQAPATSFTVPVGQQTILGAAYDGNNNILTAGKTIVIVQGKTRATLELLSNFNSQLSTREKNILRDIKVELNEGGKINSPPSITPDIKPSAKPTPTSTLLPGPPPAKEELLTAIPTKKPELTPEPVSTEGSPPPNPLSHIPLPRKLDVVARASDSLTLKWEFANTELSHSYRVLLDEKVIAENLTNSHYTFVNLNANTNYLLAVQTVLNHQESHLAIARSSTTTKGKTGTHNFGGGGAGGLPPVGTPAPMTTPSPTPTPPIFVNIAASGANTGQSWTDAFTDLQAALTLATSGRQIWVAQGTYKPDLASPNDRTLSFNLKDGVKVYGGFSGVETLLTQRDIIANTTILSGEINTGIPNDNSYHVVKGTNLSFASGTRLDGFTITRGKADGGGNDNQGGGIRLENSGIALAQLNITDNFSNNGALIGIGMHIEGGNDGIELNKVVFHNHNGLNEAALVVKNHTPELLIIQSIFNQNNCSSGGCAIQFNNVSNFEILNSTFFSNNASSIIGGGVFSASIGTIRNSIFRSIGGGAPDLQFSGPTTNVQVRNSIVDNITTSIQAVSGATVNQSAVNDSSPNFPSGGADPDGLDNIFGTADDGLKPNTGGPASNNGELSANLPSTDIIGSTRIQGATVDIGAFEIE